jgi:hypothetical protein
MTGKDLDRGARQTAARIAEQVLVHIRQANAK